MGMASAAGIYLEMGICDPEARPNMPWGAAFAGLTMGVRVAGMRL